MDRLSGRRLSGLFGLGLVSLVALVTVLPAPADAQTCTSIAQSAKGAPLPHTRDGCVAQGGLRPRATEP